MIVEQQRHDTILTAVRSSYEVMFGKMLRTVPESKRLSVVTQKTFFGDSVLFCAADSNNPQLIKHIFTLLPRSQRLQAVQVQRVFRAEEDSVLDHASRRKNFESIRFILNSLTESERFQVIRAQYPCMHQVLCGAASHERNCVALCCKVRQR